MNSPFLGLHCPSPPSMDEWMDGWLHIPIINDDEGFCGRKGDVDGNSLAGGFLASWLHCNFVTSSNFSFSSSLVNEAELSEMTTRTYLGNAICFFLFFYGSWEECLSGTNHERKKPKQKTSLPISLTATNLSPNSPFSSSSSSLMIPPPPSHLYSSLYSSLHPSSQKSPSSSTLCES